MKQTLILLFFTLSSVLFGDYNYSLQDINSTSDNYENYIGPDSFSGQVTLHYFGHQN
mgnify:CR=1 FL=1